MTSSSCSMIRVVAILSLCAAFLVVDVQAGCSLNDMAPCLGAVTHADMPSEACCLKVQAVDVPCFCDLVKNGNYKPEYVANAVNVPKNCGGLAYDHFKGKVCAGHTIN